MRKRSAVLVLVAAGAGLAACGGSSGNGIAGKSPTDVLQTSLAALDSAQSVTIVADVNSGSGEQAINGVFYSNGDFNGSVTQKGVTAKLIKIGGTDYLNAPASYWQANGASASLANRVADKWVSVPDSSAGLANTLSITSITSGFSKNHGTLSAGTTGTVDGQAAYSITSSKGGTLWVATTGTPFPIELIGSSGGTRGNITFSGYNASAIPTPPTGAIPASSLSSTTGAGTTGTGTTGSSTTSTTGTGATGNTGSTTSTTGTGTTGSTTSTTGSGTTGTTVP